jgi:hypothetical protein
MPTVASASGTVPAQASRHITQSPKNFMKVLFFGIAQNYSHSIADGLRD